MSQLKSVNKSPNNVSTLNTNTYQRKRTSQPTMIPPSMSLQSIKTHTNNQIESNQNESSNNAIATLTNQTSNNHHHNFNATKSSSCQKAHLSSFVLPTNINTNSITINIHNNNLNNNTNSDIEYSGKTFSFS